MVYALREDLFQDDDAAGSTGIGIEDRPPLLKDDLGVSLAAAVGARESDAAEQEHRNKRHLHRATKRHRKVFRSATAKRARSLVRCVLFAEQEPVSRIPCALLKLDDLTSQCICCMH